MNGCNGPCIIHMCLFHALSQHRLAGKKKKNHRGLFDSHLIWKQERLLCKEIKQAGRQASSMLTPKARQWGTRDQLSGRLGSPALWQIICFPHCLYHLLFLSNMFLLFHGLVLLQASKRLQGVPIFLQGAPSPSTVCACSVGNACVSVYTLLQSFFRHHLLQEALHVHSS